MAFQNITFTIPPPNRGTDRKDRDTNLDNKRYAADGENYVPFEFHLENRSGFVKFNTTLFNTLPLAVFHHVKTDGTDVIVANFENKIFAITATTVTEIGSLPGLPKLASFISSEGRVIFGSDVGNKIIDIDNVKLFDLGLPQQPIIPNTNITEGAVNTENWQNKGKRVRYVLQNVRKESGGVVARGGVVTPAIEIEGTIQLSGTFDPLNPAVGNDVRITIPKVFNDSVTHIHIFRTISYNPANDTRGQTPVDFAFVGEVSNIGPIVFTDDKADFLIANDTDLMQEFEMVPLPSSGHIAKSSGRIFTTKGINSNTISFGHFTGGDLEGITGGAIGNSLREVSVDVLENGELSRRKGQIFSVSGEQRSINGEPITGIFSSGREMYIWTALKTYRLRNAGAGLLNQMEEIPGNLGLTGKDAVIETGSALLVNTNEHETHGMRFLQGGAYTEDITEYKHEEDMLSITDFSKTRLFNFRDQFWLGGSFGKTFNNKILGFKPINKNWSYFRHAINMEFGVALQDGSVVIFDGSRKVFLIGDPEIFTDDGDPIKMFVKFVRLKGKNKSDIITLISGFLDIFGDIDEPFEVQIVVFVDENVNGEIITISKDADGNFNIYGSANWNVFNNADGASAFASDKAKEIMEFPFSTESTGFQIQIQLETSMEALVKFQGLEIGGTGRTLR